MIDWAAFSWEAFATLVTGLAAVGGAIYVGRKQLTISDRQSRILEQQVRLDDLRLRSELFQRRFEVYDATARYLGDVLSSGNAPNHDLERRFLRTTDAARFLFKPKVHERLWAIYMDVNRFVATKKVMDFNFRRHGHYGEGLAEKETEQISKLSDHLQNLSEVFGGELRLSDSRTA